MPQSFKKIKDLVSKKPIESLLVIVLGILLIMLGNSFIARWDKKYIDLEIKNGRLVKGTEIINVKQNDKVVFRVTSDVYDEFHLDGYHAFSRLEPNKQTLIPVDALSSGEFPIKLEKTGTYLGTLKVTPSSD